jgi:hypothetical protein
VGGSLRVIVTNKRIIVKYDHDGGKTLSVQLGDITRISRQLSSSWRILAAGAVATWVIFVSMLVPTVGSYLSSVFPSTAAGSLALAVVPFIPLIVSVPFYAMTIRNGYSIHSSSGSIFLPQQFLRLLKLVDRLSAKELFDEIEPKQEASMTKPEMSSLPESPKAPSLEQVSSALWARLRWGRADERSG